MRTAAHALAGFLVAVSVTAPQLSQIDVDQAIRAAVAREVARMQREPREAMRRARESYAMVEVRSSPGGYRDGGHGAGVYVAPDLVLTVAHNHPYPEAELLVNGRPARIVARNPQGDLMLLRTEARGVPIRMADRPAVLDDEVVVVGTPLQSPGVASWGRVSGINHQIPTFLIDCTAMPGYSGGPVVALRGPSSGRLVGVVFAAWGVNGYGRMAVAVRIESIRAFLETAGVDL